MTFEQELSTIISWNYGMQELQEIKTAAILPVAIMVN